MTSRDEAAATLWTKLEALTEQQQRAALLAKMTPAQLAALKVLIEGKEADDDADTAEGLLQDARA